MFQAKALNGKRLKIAIELKDVAIVEVFNPSTLPNGLVSIDLDTGMAEVAVTPDKRQYMKVGKLLRKNGCSEDQCKYTSAKVKAAVQAIKGAKLKFTSTEEEAYEVYKYGPHSCMSGEESVKAYSSDDVCVAYVEVGDRIVARSVVCYNEDIGKQYIRIYGFDELMEPLLHKAGYESGTLDGCKLTRIEGYNDRVLCPYLDCGTRVSDTGHSLEVDSWGEYGSQNPDGYLGRECASCGEPHLEDDMSWSEHYEDDFCVSCFGDKHVYINGSFYAMESDDVGQDKFGNFLLVEDASYSEHHQAWIPDDVVAYSDYTEDNYYYTELVDAITNVQFQEGEPCLKEDCTLYNNKWIHDDIIDEYTQQDLFEEEDE